MQPEQIRDHLRAAPFRPFRVFLSDGSFHDVPHPDFAWLTARYLFIGKDVNALGLPRREVTCDTRHITKIERESENGGP
jgi:hypothetical protein